MFEVKEGVIKPIVYVGFLKNDKLLIVDYKSSPNPSKQGWWIPAPSLLFGEDPAERAEKLAEELGIHIKKLHLNGVESFVTPGGWHLIWHYLVQTDSEPKANPNIKAIRWVDEADLAKMKDIAHGNWEIAIGKKFLQHN